MDNFKLIGDYCSELNIPFGKEEYDKLIKYMNLVLEWNKKINLTAIEEEEEFVVKHFLDSLSIFKFKGVTSFKRIGDIGTGAGFPGIPMAIFTPNIKYTLVDSLQKRINFLKIVKEELKLDNVELIHGRAEDLGHDIKYREKLQCIVGRAVANLPVLCEYCLPFIEKGGYFLALKGPSVNEEINLSKNAVKILGGSILGIEEVFLQNNEIKHNMVIIKKIKATPGTYPRKAGVVSKKPL